MGKVHVVNVVHAEPNWWDDELTGLDIGAEALLACFAGIEASMKARIPITWCLYFANGDKGPVTGGDRSDIIDNRLDWFAHRLALGDEIGLHPHALDPRDTPKYYKSNAEKLQRCGFPYPRTHAPCWFYLNGRVLKGLEEAGLAIDAGLLPRMGRLVGENPEVRGILLQDASRRNPDDYHSFRPFKPSYDDICRPGDSTITEIPVFFSYHGIEQDPDAYVTGFRSYWEHRSEVPVDIVQFFWHPWEMIHQDSSGQVSVAREIVEAFHTVFSRISKFEDVVFSTVSEAVNDWELHQKDTAE